MICVQLTLLVLVTHFTVTLLPCEKLHVKHELRSPPPQLPSAPLSTNMTLTAEDMRALLSREFYNIPHELKQHISTLGINRHKSRRGTHAGRYRRLGPPTSVSILISDVTTARTVTKDNTSSLPSDPPASPCVYDFDRTCSDNVYHGVHATVNPRISPVLSPDSTPDSQSKHLSALLLPTSLLSPSSSSTDSYPNLPVIINLFVSF